MTQIVKPGNRAPRTFDYSNNECTITIDSPVVHLQFEPNSITKFTLKVNGLSRFEGVQWNSATNESLDTSQMQTWWIVHDAGATKVFEFTEEGLKHLHKGGRLVLIDVYV